MSIIQIRELSFTYPGSVAPVFRGLNATFDSDWRLGLVGRNGRGKTTLLRLLAGELVGKGDITANVRFDIFPYEIALDCPAREGLRRAIAPFDEWSARMTVLLEDGSDEALREWGELEARYSAAGGYEIDALIEREAGRLGVPASELTRPMASFSPGERTRLQIGALFLRKNNFLLIDEPTNHLDIEGRRVVADYLRSKRGFMLVSHDRWFLDQTVDHICALERSGLRIERGDYTSYRDNKRLRDEYELAENERIESDIARLKDTAREKAVWSGKVEATKIGSHSADRGRVGHLAAKAMKRSLTIRTRIDREIEEKEGLLRDLEYASDLTLHPLDHPARLLVRLHDVAGGYDGRALFGGLTLDVARGDRLAITGENGAGKSTLVKLLLGEMEPLAGRVTRAGGLIISYMPQLPEAVSGTPFDIAAKMGLQTDYFLMLLRKLDFPREAFERDMGRYSLGQRKKVLLAASMARQAHIYVWDEPLNYMDLESREQIENMLANTEATLIFIEHDRRFVERIAGKRLALSDYRLDIESNS